MTNISNILNGHKMSMFLFNKNYFIFKNQLKLLVLNVLSIIINFLVFSLSFTDININRKILNN